MTRYDDGSDASTAAVRRVIAGVSTELSQADIRTLLQQVPGPSAHATERVLAGLPLPASGGRPRRRSTGHAWRWPVIIGGSLVGGLAFAAAGLTVGGVAPWSVRDLDAPLETTARTLRDAELRPDGEGRLLGTTSAPSVLWEQGVLEVQTARELSVLTREGEFRIGAGAATLLRDGRGTTVQAHGGTATVTCEGSEPKTLGSEGSALCRPISAEGMVGRVRLLDVDGLPADELLAEIELGLTLPATGPIATNELQTMRVFQLDRAGRADEALAAARSWLDEGHDSRRAAVQRLAGSLALRLEGCDGARAHLQALAADDADARAALAACDGMAGPDPE